MKVFSRTIIIKLDVINCKRVQMYKAIHTDSL